MFIASIVFYFVFSYKFFVDDLSVARVPFITTCIKTFDGELTKETSIGSKHLGKTNPITSHLQKEGQNDTYDLKTETKPLLDK